MKPETVLDGITEGNAIDLGLSVKWASCNVGTKSPEEIGDLYSWGEVEPKKEYTVNSCIFYVNGNEGMRNAYGPACDVARTKMGAEWRMPTKAEVEELFANCDWQWGVYKDVKGIKFISKKNGNSIFMPAGGIHSEESYRSQGAVGYYWTATLCPGEDYDATCMVTNRVSQNIAFEHRHRGLAVRPVQSSGWDDQKMFQPSVKVKTPDQYTWGMKKSGPGLKAIFLVISVILFLFLFLFVIGGILGAILDGAIVSAIMGYFRKYFFSKKEA